MKWNLDAETIEELTRIMRRTSTPRAIQEYAKEKRLAMKSRMRGDINTAMRHEHNCDLLYASLPEYLRTW